MLMEWKNPIFATCIKCKKTMTVEKERYDEWMNNRGYYLCYGCSGQRDLNEYID